MKEIEKLKEDIIKRYEMSWVDAHLHDNLGIIQECKDNFRLLVDNLVVKSVEYGERQNYKFNMDN